MSQEVTIKVHRIAEEGLPDLTTLAAGQVAFIFDGRVLSGRPLHRDEHPEAYTQARVEAGPAGAPRQLWEADEEVAHRRWFDGVTHWIEFSEPIWKLEGRWSPD
jgi:hypothetical protein